MRRVQKPRFQLVGTEKLVHLSSLGLEGRRRIRRLPFLDFIIQSSHFFRRTSSNQTVLVEAAKVQVCQNMGRSNFSYTLHLDCAVFRADRRDSKQRSNPHHSDFSLFAVVIKPGVYKFEYFHYPDFQPFPISDISISFDRIKVGMHSQNYDRIFVRDKENPDLYVAIPTVYVYGFIRVHSDLPLITFAPFNEDPETNEKLLLAANLLSETLKSPQPVATSPALTSST